MVPFEHFPEIDSSLQWDQVHLPPSVSEAQVDRIIFSFVKPQWRKMALIVYQATEEGQKLAPGLTDEVFAARIQVLVAAERLESQGDDLRKWRHSEVRLKPAALRLAKSDS